MSIDRKYHNQFPKDFHEIPKEILDRVASGDLTDSSWGNDVCPSFKTPDEYLTLWVDHPNPERRELEGKRFAISREDADGNAEELATSDSVEEILAKLDELAEAHEQEQADRKACADCQRIYGPQAQWRCKH